METKSGVDRFGKVVEVGDFVRLLAIRPSIMKRLAGKEHADVSSMLGKVLKVFDIYDDGLVWVSLIWEHDDGTSEVHAIAVDTSAIEFVSKASEKGRCDC